MSVALFVALMFIRFYKHIKSIIPNHWKYPFWFVFKAPQRKWGWQTLWRDLLGIGQYLVAPIRVRKKLEPISICTGIYNRSEQYLQHMLSSLLATNQQELIELSLFDCGSEDQAHLIHEIKMKWKGSLVFRTENVPFTRAYSFNQAVQQSAHSLLFICDADLSIPKNIVTLCNQYTGPRTVWFPMLYFLFNPKKIKAHEPKGKWDVYGGRGMFASTRKAFEEIGGFDEQFKTYGDEDLDIWERFHKSGYRVIRNRQQGLIHHWHNSHNVKYLHMND